MEKDHEISQDDSKRALDDIQKMTDRCVAMIDEVLQAKEKEILEI